MLLIIGTIRLPAENVAFAREAMGAMATASRAEDGCIEYGYAEDVFDPGLIHVKERRRDRAAFAAPHITEWRAAWQALGIGERALTLYAVDAGQPI